MNKRFEKEKEFEILWKQFKAELLATGGRVDMEIATDVLPHAKRALTTVSRISENSYHRISEIQNELRSLEPNHYYYPLDDLHFTIYNCMRFLRNPEEPSTAEIEGIAEKLNDVFSEFTPFSVALRGLNIFPTTIYLQVFDDGVIEAMRNRIINEVGEIYINPILEPRGQSRTLSYVNLVRFTRPVSNELVAAVSRLRSVELGKFDVHRIELVQTDKLMSKSGTSLRRDYTLKSEPNLTEGIID